MAKKQTRRARPSGTRPKPVGKPARKLADYAAKRDFTKTAEPQAGQAPPGAAAIFVVHKHQATRLHYDLRLQIGQTLASWAVPKGPSLDPTQKRLAVRVEDHPLDYADFEGAIPPEEYGGGTVMVWDFGTVAFKAGPSAEGMLEAGLLEFELSGRKLAGGFKLVRTRMGGSEKNWLLIKRKDAAARPGEDILMQQPDSAKTGRSLEQITSDAASQESA